VTHEQREREVLAFAERLAQDIDPLVDACWLMVCLRHWSVPIWKRLRLSSSMIWSASVPRLMVNDLVLVQA